MSVDRRYKDCLCVQKMNDAHKDTFDTLVESYGETLNTGNRINSVLYTLHDFNHHCINIFHIISSVILDQTCLSSGIALTEDELFLLNLGVLFHDISMATEITCERKTHSLQSAEYIKKTFENHSSILYKAIQNQNVINALYQIVLAHSDVKNGIDNSLNGIRNPDLKERMPVPTGTVRAKLLAGILRLADELDVTSDRIGDLSYADQLREEIPAEAESKQHWSRLHYFSAVSTGERNGVVNLVVDDAFVRREIDLGNLQNVVDAICEVEEKATRELSDIDKVIFSVTHNANLLVTIKTLEVSTEITEIKTLIDEIKSKTNVQASSPTLQVAEVDKQEITTPTSPLNPPQLLNSELAKEIYDHVENRMLFHSGHYLINSSFCARDWIDTAEILETEDISEKCVMLIARHIRDNPDLGSSSIIVGLDFEGTLLASKVAFTLQKPLSFILPVQPIDKNVSHDKEVDLKDFDQVILITDAIATWETVKSAIETYDIHKKLVAIYTVLYRTPLNEKIEVNKDLLLVTFSLNNDFPIEVFKRENCSRWGSHRCIAKNKPTD